MFKEKEKEAMITAGVSSFKGKETEKYVRFIAFFFLFLFLSFCSPLSVTLSLLPPGVLYRGDLLCVQHLSKGENEVTPPSPRRRRNTRHPSLSLSYPS